MVKLIIVMCHGQAMDDLHGNVRVELHASWSIYWNRLIDARAPSAARTSATVKSSEAIDLYTCICIRRQR